ncbi:hypothetical protein NQ318_012919 [Aromia moschata]|uniref:Uncharacterized protein n=1 Tax=Aromia moschata TaxID=1265417 RepID=A0AAV8XN26_9CUCU|nr:hypothetical protein NQ318_012919 [Aromia moschata]
MYDKAKEDLSWALRLNENCLKSWLLLAKANFESKNFKEYNKAIEDAIQRNPGDAPFIRDFKASLEKEDKDEGEAKAGKD